MKRMLCLLFALVMLASLGTQAFADEVLYCRMCGKQIPTDSKVCSYCGEKVVRVAEAETEKTVEGTEKKASATAEKISAPSPATDKANSGPFGTTGSAAVSNSPGRVYVTKSPTSETVPYGGSCMFIAHAANAASVTWYISSADTSMITTAADAPGKISGLSVSGANADTLTLYGIPSWMNGCQVQACFTGEGGPVYTEIARIWTYDPNPGYYGCDTRDNSWNWWKSAYWHNVTDGRRLSDEPDSLDHEDLDFYVNPFFPLDSGWAVTAKDDDDGGKVEGTAPTLPEWGSFHVDTNAYIDDADSAGTGADDSGSVDAISMTDKGGDDASGGIDAIFADDDE